jgi:hypothetical protein
MDTGVAGVFTGYLSGALEMIRWVPTTDTGGSILISIVPNENDTGSGYVVWNDTGKASDQYTVFPRAKPNLSGGSEISQSDTGVSAEKYVGVGDLVKVVITPGGLTVTGTLWVYWNDKV